MLANFTAQINGEMKVGRRNGNGRGDRGNAPRRHPKLRSGSSCDEGMIKEIPSGGTMYQLAAMMTGVRSSGGAAVVDVGGASGRRYRRNSATAAQLGMKCR